MRKSSNEYAKASVNSKDIHVSHSLIEGRDGESRYHNRETQAETERRIDGGMVGVAIVVKTIHVFRACGRRDPGLKIYSTQLRRNRYYVTMPRASCERHNGRGPTFL